MRVLFFVAGDETRASTRYRVVNLLPYLRAADIEPAVQSSQGGAQNRPVPGIFGFALSLALLTLRAPFYDVVYVQKVPLPGPYIRLLRLFVPVIFDFDDAIFATKPFQAATSPLERFFEGSLEAASLVVAGSPNLADYARQYSKRVRCLPPGLPREPYEELRDERADDDGVTLGWIGNPQNLIYLDAFETSIDAALDECDDLSLLIITAGDFPVKPFEDRSDVEYREWSLDTELDSLSEVDVGIRPLFDDEWTRHKGGFVSVAQVMAMERPVIVTPVGYLTEIVEHGESGFHATDEEDWQTYIETLAESAERRRSMGRKALQRLDELNYWTEDRAESLIAILRAVTEAESGSV